MDSSTIIKRLAESRFLLAGTELAMNYYGLYDRWLEPEEGERATLYGMEELTAASDFFERVNAFVISIFEGEGEADCSAALQLREEIRQRTMALVEYADRFKLYEYVINRTKPVPKASLKDINNDAAARDILSAVFSVNDNLTINENIKFISSQLPVRMTKTRFFDILDNSLKKYIGGELSAMKRGVYMIESAAALKDNASGNDSHFAFFDEAVAYFEGIDFTAVEADEHSAAEERLKDTVGRVLESSELLESLEAIMNSVCVVLMTRVYTGADAETELFRLRPIVREASEGFQSGRCTVMSDAVLKTFTATEGRLEMLSQKLQGLEISAENLEHEDEEAFSKISELLFKTERLMSASTFAELEEEHDEITDEAAQTRAFRDLKAEFEHAFDGGSRIMNRARMAATFAELPVFFESRTDVMNYVRESIDGCRDLYEKLVSVRLIMDAIGKG